MPDIHEKAVLSLCEMDDSLHASEDDEEQRANSES